MVPLRSIIKVIGKPVTPYRFVTKAPGSRSTGYETLIPFVNFTTASFSCPILMARMTNPLSLYLLYTFSITGISSAQDLHQSAQKRMTTALPFRSSGNLHVFPLISDNAKSGAVWPVLKMTFWSEHPQNKPEIRTKETANNDVCKYPLKFSLTSPLFFSGISAPVVFVHVFRQEGP